MSKFASIYTNALKKAVPHITNTQYEQAQKIASTKEIRLNEKILSPGVIADRAIKINNPALVTVTGYVDTTGSTNHLEPTVEVIEIIKAHYPKAITHTSPGQYNIGIDVHFEATELPTQAEKDYFNKQVLAITNAQATVREALTTRVESILTAIKNAPAHELATAKNQMHELL